MAEQECLLQVYWLELDYLAVAAAALRCAASLTALMYVEYWCEQQCNALQMPSRAAQAEVSCSSVSACHCASHSEP